MPVQLAKQLERLCSKDLKSTQCDPLDGLCDTYTAHFGATSCVFDHQFVDAALDYATQFPNSNQTDTKSDCPSTPPDTGDIDKQTDKVEVWFAARHGAYIALSDRFS